MKFCFFFCFSCLSIGPGCSSVAFGEAEEIGPFHIKSDGKTLYLNQYSWNQGNEMRCCRVCSEESYDSIIV